MHVLGAEVANTADTPNPPLKKTWESPRVKENLTLVGFEPTTSGLDLPMLWILLSYDKDNPFMYTGPGFPVFNVIIEFN